MVKSSTGNKMMKRPKVIFIMGATGTGKSKLSVDIATRIPAEIINSDKIQVYKGLDIVTNKLHVSERRGVPHHLLGTIADPDADFSAQDFVDQVNHSIARIIERRRIPVIVGGSNSYLKALVENNSEQGFRSKYECCFIWLDVSLPTLFDYVDKRVDQMVNAGLVDEIRDFFEPGADYSRGVRRAIGVPEMEKYLLVEKNMACNNINAFDKEGLLRDAIEETKHNTRRLVSRQLDKIKRLRDESGWQMHRMDATSAFEMMHRNDHMAQDAWDETVLKPSLKILGDFLTDDDDDENKSIEITTKNSTSDEFRSSSPIFVL